MCRHRSPLSPRSESLRISRRALPREAGEAEPLFAAEGVVKVTGFTDALDDTPARKRRPEFWGEVQPPASLKGLDIPSRRAVFAPWKPSRRAGVRNGKPDFSLRNQCCRRGCTSRRNPPALHGKCAPLRQCNRASLLVNLPRDEMPLLIEMILDLGVN
jgi:hypothetical protein